MINCSDRGKKACTNDIGGRSTEIEKESDTKSPHTSDRGVDVSSGTTGADGREPSSVTPQFIGVDTSKDASTKKNSKIMQLHPRNIYLLKKSYSSMKEA